MRNFFTFVFADDGSTAVEYGLLAAIMSVALIVGYGAFSEQLVEVFRIIEETLSP